MSHVNQFILYVFVLFFLSSCGRKSYVFFDYNCNGREYHKCELKNNKLNCNIEIPTCGEYKFKGWYKANEYENPINLTSSFKKNEIIYARWEKEEPMSAKDLPEDIDISSSFQTIEEPSSQQPQTIPEETYIISFNQNGGSGGQSSSISGVKYGDKLPNISQTKPVRSGYIFMGWYDSQTGGAQYYNSTNISVRMYDKKSNITLYAHWTAQTYKITFNINGGKGMVPSEVYATYGGAMPTITSTIPTKKYYTFMGWYDNADYTKGTQYYSNQNKPVKKFDKKTNTILYAGWYIDDAASGEFVPDTGSAPKCNNSGKYALCSPNRGIFGSFSYYDSEPNSTENRWSMKMNPSWGSSNFVSIKKICSNGWVLDFKVHRLAKTAWEKALNGLCQITTTGIDGYKYTPSDFNFSGAHPVIRFISGTKTPTNHAYGIAVDINSDAKYVVNGVKYAPYERKLSSYEAFVKALGREDDPRNVNYIIWKKIFQPLGFKWGGNWGRYGNKSTFDGMHFEIDWRQTRS